MYRALMPETRAHLHSFEDDEMNSLMSALDINEDEEAKSMDVARANEGVEDYDEKTRRELVGLTDDTKVSIREVDFDNIKKNVAKSSNASSTGSSVQEYDEQGVKILRKRLSLYIGAMVVRTSLHKMHAEVERLTLTQREIVRATYKKIQKHPIQFGLSIMIRLFSNHPTYKNIWPQFRQLPDSSLMHSTVLRSHARVYMGGLKVIINSMDKDEMLERSLRGIAHAHVKWKVHKKHLIDMLPCILETFETHFPLSDEAKEGWTTLFDVIANLIDIFRTQ
ncbi:Glb-14 [Aphelenchoides besseyi]|nr:Glb-14 [Aphelenchoides besseyi]